MNTFAFLAYPRDLTQDLSRFSPLPALKRLPEVAYEYALRRTASGPVVIGQLSSAQHPLQGHVISVPLTSHQLKTLPVQLVQERVNEAIMVAQDLGAQVMGLGALTTERPDLARNFARHQNISIAGGAAYRAASVVLEIERLLKHLPRKPTITLMGSDEHMLQILTPVLQKLQGIHVLNTATLPEPARLREADLLVLLGDLTEFQIRSDHLRYNAIVLNASRGKVLDHRVLRDRSDVILTDSSVFNPAIRIQGGPGHTLCPSLTETMLLALDGHRGHFALDLLTADQLEHLLLLLKKHPHLQFEFHARQNRPVRSLQRQETARWI